MRRRDALQRVRVRLHVVCAPLAFKTDVRVAPGNNVVAHYTPPPQPSVATSSLLAGKGQTTAGRRDGVQPPHFHDHAILACYQVFRALSATTGLLTEPNVTF